MSDTHIKTVIVELDDYATTGSKGGVVVDMFDLLRTEGDGTNTEGEYAVPSAMIPYVVDAYGTLSEKTTMKSKYKKIQLDDDHADVDNVQIGWILDSATGTTLRNPNT